MTPEQEAIAEKIMQLHKDNDAYFDWTSFYYSEGRSIMPLTLSDRKKDELLELIKARLVALDLIEITNITGDKSRLKETGFSFVSFADRRRKQAKKDREESIKTFPQRYWWLVGLFAYFGGWGSELMRDRYLSKKTQDTILSTPTIQVKADTNLNHKIPSSSDTFYKPK